MVTSRIWRMESCEHNQAVQRRKH